MSEKARTSGALAPIGPTEAQVAAYLRAHPEFLRQHRDLLGVLAPPARDFGGAGPADAGADAEIVDLQHYMLAHLKNEVRKRDKQYGTLVTAGRDNLQSQNRIHTAVLALLAARSLDHFLELIGTDIPVLLELDVATLCLENGDVSRVTAEGLRVLPCGLVDELLGERRDVLLSDDGRGDRRLFGEGAGLVRSSALLRVRVKDGAPDALLALGCRETGRFHHGQGTELLAFLAKVVAHAIRTWLDLPR